MSTADNKRRCLVNKLPIEILSLVFTFGLILFRISRTEQFTDRHLQVGTVELIFMTSLTPRLTNMMYRLAKYIADGSNRYFEQEAEDGFETPDCLKPYNVTVSHVCRLWRYVALSTPAIWTQIYFSVWEMPPFERCREWCRRSKTSPLRFKIGIESPSFSCRRLLRYQGRNPDGSVPFMQLFAPLSSVKQGGSPLNNQLFEKYGHEELASIFDIITPLVSQWESLELSTISFSLAQEAMNRMAKCTQGAPLLRTLMVTFDNNDYDSDMNLFSFRDEMGNPRMLFGGFTPLLESVRLDHIRMSWSQLIIPPSSLMQNTWKGLTELCLSRLHPRLRPTYEDFVKMLEASPNLNELRLINAGPQMPTSPSAISTIYLHSLWALKLVLDAQTASHVLNTLYVPHVKQLSFAIDSAEENEGLCVYKRLSQPMRHPTIIPMMAFSNAEEEESLLNSQLPILHGVQTLCLSDVDHTGPPQEDIHGFFKAAPSLEELALDLHRIDIGFLWGIECDIEDEDSSEGVLCTELDTLVICGPMEIDPDVMRAANSRMFAGYPLNRLLVDTGGTDLSKQMYTDPEICCNHDSVEFIDFEKYLETIENN
ncbi:hypothetical protein DFH11DRAFT_1544171 [Phellopilus nigrolimitatus]|nr:hypothetical protein DFH11DRAFT_1544171 [Phellopilus nigrolimitatus]